MKKLISGGFFLFFFFLISIIHGESLFQKFCREKSLEEAFLYLKNEIKLEDTAGIKFSPNQLLERSKGNILEKYYFLAQFLEEKEIHWRWRRLIINKKSKIGDFFLQLQSRYGLKNYFILEIMYQGGWKPVDLFWGDSFFTFRYFGKKAEFYFQLPEEFFWRLKLEVSVNFCRFFKDFLNLKNEKEEWKALYRKSLLLCKWKDDFIKINFFPQLLSQKMVVAVTDRVRTKLFKFDNIQKYIGFNQFLEKRIRTLKIKTFFYPANLSREKQYSFIYETPISYSHPQTYSFYLSPSISPSLPERKEREHLKRKLEELSLLAIGPLKDEAKVSFLKSFLFVFKYKNYFLADKIYLLLKKFSLDVFWYPLILKEDIFSSQVNGEVILTDAFKVCSKKDNFIFSLLKVFSHLNLQKGIAGKIYFIQDLLKKDFPFSQDKRVISALLEGKLLYRFNYGEWLKLDLTNYRWSCFDEGKRKNFFNWVFEEDFSKKKDKKRMPFLWCYLKYSLGEGHLNFSFDFPDLKQKMESFRLNLKTLLLEKFLEIKLLEKKYELFYQQQQYGKYNSLLEKTSYFPGKEDEYTRVLLEFYRDIFKEEEK